MTSIRKEPESLLPTMGSRLTDWLSSDRFPEEPFSFFPFFRNGHLLNRVPATNIREEDQAYLVEVAVPGMNKKDFSVDVNNNVLEIKVEKERESGEDKPEYMRKEYDYTAFYRSFTLPESVIAEKIEATYKDGILRVVLPKTSEAKTRAARKIAVG